MSPDLKKCKDQALKLPPEERALLAEHLIESLDSLDEAGNELLCLEEAKRRYKAYKNGDIPARPAGEVLRDARSSIK